MPYLGLGGLSSLTMGVDYCPINETESLSDDFSSYLAGVELPVSAYSRRDGSGGTRTMLVQAGPVLRVPIAGAAVGANFCSMYVAEAGIEESECGVYVQVQMLTLPGGSHGYGGICIGMTDNVGDVNMLALGLGRLNGANTVLARRLTAGDTFAGVGLTPVTFPGAVEQFFRIELLAHKKLCVFKRLQPDGVTLIQQINNTIDVADVALGVRVGLFACGDGGSGGGSASTFDMANFSAGFL